jgi:hypothetical protein
MSDLSERTIGGLFGLLGGGLLLIAALVSVVVGAVDAALGHPLGAIGAVSAAVALGVVGLLSLFFTYLAYRPWRERPLTGGILLIVLAAVGWGVLAFGANILAVLGVLFVFLAGLLFLIPATIAGAKTLATA